MNKEVYNADLAVLIGHVQNNPYEKFSGAYNHCVSGITNWRSLVSKQLYFSTEENNFSISNNKQIIKNKFIAIGQHMEKYMNKKFYTCDAVLDNNSNQIAILSGCANEVQKLSSEFTNKKNKGKLVNKKYDILMFGLPEISNCENGNEMNSAVIMQAITYQIIKYKRLLNDNCVIICSSPYKESFHEAYQIFKRNYANILHDYNQFGNYLSTRKDYIDKYRNSYAYHPFHAFSTICYGHIAENNSSAIYIVGNDDSMNINQLGIKTVSTFEKAINEAKELLGGNPKILALPLSHSSLNTNTKNYVG